MRVAGVKATKLGATTVEATKLEPAALAAKMGRPAPEADEEEAAGPDPLPRGSAKSAAISQQASKTSCQRSSSATRSRKSAKSALIAFRVSKVWGKFKCQDTQYIPQSPSRSGEATSPLAKRAGLHWHTAAGS